MTTRLSPFGTTVRSTCDPIRCLRKNPSHEATEGRREKKGNGSVGAGGHVGESRQAEDVLEDKMGDRADAPDVVDLARVEPKEGFSQQNVIRDRRLWMLGVLRTSLSAGRKRRWNSLAT